jgi:DNA-binding transcriptional ArsR family regulator
MSELKGYDIIVSASRQAAGSSAKAVLCWLAYFADRKSRTCYPCQELLAALIGSTARTVRNALTELENKKLITRQKRRSGNRQTSDLITLSKAIFQAETISGSKSFQAENNVTLRRKPFPGNYIEQGAHSAQAEMPPKKNKSIRP